jgi:hypothetical protein
VTAESPTTEATAASTAASFAPWTARRFSETKEVSYLDVRSKFEPREILFALVPVALDVRRCAYLDTSAVK